MEYHVKLNKRDLKGRGTCQEEYNSDLGSLVKVTHLFIFF